MAFGAPLPPFGGRLTSLSWCHLIPVPDEFSRAGQLYREGRWVVLTEDPRAVTSLPGLPCCVLSIPLSPTCPIYNHLRSSLCLPKLLVFTCLCLTGLFFFSAIFQWCLDVNLEAVSALQLPFFPAQTFQSSQQSLNTNTVRTPLWAVAVQFLVCGCCMILVHRT